MKTFLWTTLFWIVAAIALLLCLWFGNLWTQVLDNGWLASVMPKNLKAESCDAVVQTTLENMDWCAAAEENNCNLVSEENGTEVLSGDTARLQEPLSSIIANQEIIYKYLQDSFSNLDQSINKIQNGVSNMPESLIDEKEQQRQELQAQIEALQAEMNNL